MLEKIHYWIEKKEDFYDLSQILQCKYMAYFYIKLFGEKNFKPCHIKKLFEDGDITVPSNINSCFRRLFENKIILKNKLKGFYIFHKKEFDNLEEEFRLNTPKTKTSVILKNLLEKVNVKEEKKYLEEAIDCYEIGAYRGAIILTWLLVVDSLQEFIFLQKLNDFNLALSKQNLKIKKIVKKDDFSELKEVKFIELCRSSNIITPDIRKILDEKLGTRNTCAHPNKILISESKATSFIEDLILNVYLVYK